MGYVSPQRGGRVEDSEIEAGCKLVTSLTLTVSNV